MTAHSTQPCGTQTLHRSQSGIRSRSLDASPRAYARQLARYIRDASTIRASTMNNWGTAPSIDECREMIAAVQAERDAFKAESEKLVARDGDAADFTVSKVKREERKDRRIVLHVDFNAPINVRTFNPAEMTAGDVIAYVARAYRLKPEDLTGPSRKKIVMVPRRIAMYALYKRGGLSYPAIGRMFGGRDHSTVVHAMQHFAANADDTMMDMVAKLVPGGLA